MSSAKSFEDLLVWQKSRDFTKNIYNPTNSWPDRSLQDQIRRASVSVMSNIAEGFERGTNLEFLHFLYIARGSAAEVRAQLYVALDAKYIEHSTLEHLNKEVKIISAMLYNLIESIKGSKLKGSKFKKTTDKETEEFENYLQDIIDNSRNPQP